MKEITFDSISMQDYERLNRLNKEYELTEEAKKRLNFYKKVLGERKC